jgi:hypothetical protein
MTKDRQENLSSINVPWRFVRRVCGAYYFYQKEVQVCDALMYHGY